MRRLTKNQKAKLRKTAIKILSSLSKKEITKASEKIEQKVIGSNLFIKAKTIFIYQNFENEVKTGGIIKYAISKNKKILMPVFDKSWKYPDFAKIDLTILPCLFIDKEGNRLGRGGGYYDRFLETYEGDSIVICFKEQIIDELPSEPHDFKIKNVVSDID